MAAGMPAGMADLQAGMLSSQALRHLGHECQERLAPSPLLLEAVACICSTWNAHTSVSKKHGAAKVCSHCTAKQSQQVVQSYKKRQQSNDLHAMWEVGSATGFYHCRGDRRNSTRREHNNLCVHVMHILYAPCTTQGFAFEAISKASGLAELLLWTNKKLTIVATLELCMMACLLPIC